MKNKTRMKLLNPYTFLAAAAVGGSLILTGCNTTPPTSGKAPNSIPPPKEISPSEMPASKTKPNLK